MKQIIIFIFIITTNIKAQNIGVFSYLSNYSKLSSTSSQPLLKTDNGSNLNFLMPSFGISFNTKKDYEFRVFIGKGYKVDSTSYKNENSLIQSHSISKDKVSSNEFGICFLKHQKIGIISISIGLFANKSKYNTSTYQYEYKSSRQNISTPFLYTIGYEANITSSPFNTYQIGLILGLNYTYKNIITLGFELLPNIKKTLVSGEQEYKYTNYGSNKTKISEETIKQIDNATSYDLNLINPKLILRIGINFKNNKKKKPLETNKEEPYTK